MKCLLKKTGSCLSPGDPSKQGIPAPFVFQRGQKLLRLLYELEGLLSLLPGTIPPDVNHITQTNHS